MPIATGCCVLIVRGLWKYLPNFEVEVRQSEETENEHNSHILSFDYPGAISLGIAITSILTVIDLQNQLTWGHPLVLGIAITGVMSVLAFVALETYPGDRELLVPLQLLGTEIGAFCAAQVRYLFVARRVGSAQGTQLRAALQPGLILTSLIIIATNCR